VVYRPSAFTPFELQCAQVYGHTQLYALPESLKKHPWDPPGAAACGAERISVARERAGTQRSPGSPIR
jgi:hypothetical protein